MDMTEGDKVTEEAKLPNAELAFVIVKNMDGSYRILDSITDEIVIQRRASRLDVKLAAGEVYDSISNAETAEAVIAIIAKSQQAQDKSEQPAE